MAAVHQASQARRRLAWGTVVGISILIAACAGSEDSPTAAVPPVCGNGILEQEEECDDGNVVNGDSCLSICRLPVAWTTSDPHLHLTGCDRDTSLEELFERLRAKKISVGAVLVWGNGFEHDAQFFTGDDHPLSTEDLILHFDMEVSRLGPARMGHLILLGLDSLAFSDDVFTRPTSGVPVVDWARAQPRAVAGMAHVQYWPSDGSFPAPPGGCCTPFETVVHIAREKLDFVSTDRVPDGQGAVDDGTFLVWRSAQNSGFRVAIAGGSDWLCAHQPGDEFPLTDVIVDGPLTYDNWLDGIRAGRTAAVKASAAGVHLNVDVEGRRLGEQLDMTGPGEVELLVEATNDQPYEVEILVNGETRARLAMDAGVQVAETRIAITQSAWIAARSPRVLTSPVYVLVAGQPIRASASDTCYLLRSVEDLRFLVTNDWLRLSDGREEALLAYQGAIDELSRRHAESGGGACP